MTEAEAPKRNLAGLTSRSKGLVGSLPKPTLPKPALPAPASTPGPALEPITETPGTRRLATEVPAGGGAESEEIPTQPGPHVEQSGSAEVRKPTRRVAKITRATSVRDDESEIPMRGGKALFTITLPASLLAGLKAASVAAGASYGDWFLDAFDNQYRNLETIFPPPAERNSPLPPRRQAGRRRSTEGSPPVQLYMELDAAKVVEDTRRRCGALPRATFCARIIGAELEERQAG